MRVELEQRTAHVVGPTQRCARIGVVVALVTTAIASPIWGAQPDEGRDLESVVKRAQAYRKTYDGWRAVRQLDCARCHGADYRGSVGPSLIESVQTRSRSDFTRVILDGSPERGMPPYKSVARVVDNLDGIYEYFRGLADGSIPAGQLTAPE